MSLAGTIFFLLALALCSLLVLAPLTSSRRADRPGPRDARERARLRQDYEALLTALRDLDEDRLTGKIDSDAHAREREGLLQRGEGLLAALEASARDGSP